MSIDIGAGCLDSIESISTGHAAEGDTRVIVITTSGGAIGVVDVRGGGPGTRETDLLALENTVERAHAIVLVGGSAYGLTATDGVMRELCDRGIGFKATSTRPDILVPIVPGAVILDLLLGEPTLLTAGLGREVLSYASDDALEGTPSGIVGADVGAMAGTIKGGFGRVRMTSADGKYFVVAAMVVNSLGAVIDPRGCLYGISAAAGTSKEALAQLGQIFAGRAEILVDAVGDEELPAST